MATLDFLIEQSRKTLKEISAASGLDENRVEAIFEGRWTPSLEERTAIAGVFGLPVEEIAFGHNMNPRNIRFHRFGVRENLDSEQKP